MAKGKNKYSSFKYNWPVLVFLAAGIALIVVGIIQFVNFSSGSDAGILLLGIILLGVGVLLVAIGSLWAKIMTDKSRRICDACGESMYGCAYEYEEKKRRFVKSASNDGSGHIEVDVYIRAKCPHCGEIKQFQRTFKITENSDNIQYQVDNFCRKSFGH